MFTAIHTGSRVSYKQEVRGTLTGIPQKMQAWLVIQPNNVSAAYWPQPPPLQPDQNHHFSEVATLGASANTDHGEKFNLMIVETDVNGGGQFQAFLDNPADLGQGMPSLPQPSHILTTQITVIRS
jgi:hypothetical protein